MKIVLDKKDCLLSDTLFGKVVFLAVNDLAKVVSKFHVLLIFKSLFFILISIFPVKFYS